jgi:hypothetical protein
MKRKLVGRMHVVEENGRPEIYIEMEGKRIAKRGHPDTAHAGTWISLEPGWVVRDVDYPNGIEIEYIPAVIQH